MTNILPGENIKKLFYIFELLPFKNLYIEILHKDISKPNIASSFKHGQLIKKMISRLPGEN